VLELALEPAKLSRSDSKTSGKVRLFKSCSSILGFVSDSIGSMSVCSVDSGSSIVSSIREV